ncbi:class F sortase [Aquipuribacter sp. MA13-6]|uniref:class F sortase n=1 Tax=unclassified Aquipuribacter TaxID=2635084 RepID=UPI003EEEA822
MVVLAVAAVVLAAGGLASLVAGDRSATAVPRSGSGTERATTAGPTAASIPASAAPTAPLGTGPATGPSAASAATPATGPAVPGPQGVVAANGAPAPVSLRVPTIDVDLSSLVRLGVAGDGTIEVPEDPDDAGWLTASASPGRTGPAVIAGHVDTRDGPAVFARLGELAPGDEVVVGLEDGTAVTYAVTGSETYPKTEFPTERVYGPAPAPVLRLITCGGDFDRSVSSYEDNVVVYAVLVG